MDLDLNEEKKPDTRNSGESMFNTRNSGESRFLAEGIAIAKALWRSQV